MPTPDPATRRDHHVRRAPRTSPRPARRGARDRELTYVRGGQRGAARELDERPEVVVYGEDVGAAGGIFGVDPRPAEGVRRRARLRHPDRRERRSSARPSARRWRGCGRSSRSCGPTSCSSPSTSSSTRPRTSATSAAAGARGAARRPHAAGRHPGLLRAALAEPRGAARPHPRPPGRAAGDAAGRLRDAARRGRRGRSGDPDRGARALPGQGPVAARRPSPRRVGGARLRRRAATSRSQLGAMVARGAGGGRGARRRRRSTRRCSTCAGSPRSTTRPLAEAVPAVGRVLVVHEANVTGGFGAEVAARIHEHHSATSTPPSAASARPTSACLQHQPSRRHWSRRSGTSWMPADRWSRSRWRCHWGHRVEHGTRGSLRLPG